MMRRALNCLQEQDKKWAKHLASSVQRVRCAMMERPDDHRQKHPATQWLKALGSK